MCYTKHIVRYGSGRKSWWGKSGGEKVRKEEEEKNEIGSAVPFSAQRLKWIRVGRGEGVAICRFRRVSSLNPAKLNMIFHNVVSQKQKLAVATLISHE